MAVLDAERQEKAKAYARATLCVSFGELSLGAAALLLLLFTSLSAGLRDLLNFPQPVKVVLYFTVVAVSLSVVSAPLTFYGGYVLPRRFGLLNQSLGNWLFDVAKRGLLGVLLGSGVVVLVYVLLASVPDLWWLLAAACVVLLGVLLANLTPVILLPLFYKLEPLADDGLRDRLESLAHKARTKVRGIFTINLSSKGTTGNAALVGLGNTRRIVIGDTLLDRYSPEEIEVVVAHELGHHVHRDILRLIVIQSVTVFLGFYLAHVALNAGVAVFGFNGIEDVAAFPLLAGVLGGFALLVEPLSNAYSRRIEAAADDYALNLTGNPEGFVAMMTKLANQNLSEAWPKRWVEVLLYDHPPYFRRVARAESYREGEK